MNYNNDFSHDLALGQLGEDYVGEILSNSTIEVKSDLQAHKTGNVYVEYESRGKPSGISTSQAEYWAFVISGRVVILPTAQLKKIARLYFKPVAGGDNNTSKGVLIPLTALLEHY